MVWFGGSWVLDLGSHSWSLSCNPLCDMYSILRHTTLTTLQVGLSWVDLTTISITVIWANFLQLQISVYSADQIMAVAVCMAITARQRDTERKTDRERTGQGRAGQGRMVYLDSTPQERLFRLQAHLPTYEDTVADRGLGTAGLFHHINDWSWKTSKNEILQLIEGSWLKVVQLLESLNLDRGEWPQQSELYPFESYCILELEQPIVHSILCWI